MQVSATVSEIGAFTVLDVISSLGDEVGPLLRDLCAQMPLDLYRKAGPVGRLAEALSEAVSAIPTVRSKSTLISAGCEVALLEAIREAELEAEVVVAVESSLPRDSVERIKRNTPFGLSCDVVRVPTLPTDIQPRHALLVAVGLCAGYRWALLPNGVAAAVRSYSQALPGEIVMLDPIGVPSLERFPGWTVVEIDRAFTRVVRPEGAGSSLRDSWVQTSEVTGGTRWARRARA